MSTATAVKKMKVMPEEIIEVYKTATCLYSKSEVETAFDRISEAMTKQLAETNPVLLCVVVGGIVTLGNLLPRLNFPLEVDYVHVTRYHQTTKGQKLVWKATPSTDLKGRNVVLVDDILDGGITLKHIVDYCETQNANSIHTAVLVDKASARLPEGLKVADFCGLTVENHYVFGYGLDYKGYLRNAPGIYKVAPQFE